MRSFLTKVLVIIMAVNAIGVAKDLSPLSAQADSSFSSSKVSADHTIASNENGTHQDCKNNYGGAICNQCHLGHCAFVLPAPTSGRVALNVTVVDSSTESTFVNRSIAPPSKPPKSA